MSDTPMLSFGPYHLDLASECLWRGTQPVPLRPKPWALLRYLVEHAGRVVPAAELRQALWPDTKVSAGVLKGYIHDLRVVFGDDLHSPQFIETVGRRGYRFIAPLTNSAPLVSSSTSQVSSIAATPAPRPLSPASLMVGREAELQQIHTLLEKALRGERQVVFVTGEAGIGKTTVAEAFVERVVRPYGYWLGQGQCIEHFGTGEAYLPILAALGQLCRGSGGERLIELLSQHAPMWLLQLPALLSTGELEALQWRTAGATRERMLRELAEALEVFTAKQPLVLWLEDLHWSDTATLDLLTFVARRRQPSRLLVIGTYRPVEVILQAHPLRQVKQELQLYGQCQELALEFLPEGAVAEYLGRRWPACRVPAAVAQRLYQRTEGNPLFIVTLVEELIAQGLLVATGKELALQHEEQVTREVPENLQQMIEQQLERLNPEEQRVLEAASVAGAEFSAAAVAAGAEVSVEEVEECSVGLTRRGLFLRVKGVAEWPDGTVAARYEFLHALYQEVTYERVPAGRRAHLHQRIGEREEGAYGARAGEIAAELAVHFEQGRDYRRAVQYLQHAGKNAIQRSAYQEAIRLLTKGLALLATLPDTPERAWQELALQVALGISLIATESYAAPEVAKVYTRARELCEQIKEPSLLIPTLVGLWVSSFVRARLQPASEMGNQLLSLARSQQDLDSLLWAHTAIGFPLFWRGEFASARAHLEQGIASYEPQLHQSSFLSVGQDLGVGCLSYLAWCLWFLGYPDQARQRSHEALSLVQRLSHPLSLALSLFYATCLDHSCQEWRAVQERAEEEMRLCSEYGLIYWLSLGTILRGRALVEQGHAKEGIGLMREGWSAYEETGSELTRSYYLALLAEGCRRTGQVENEFSALAEALTFAEQSGERIYEAELYRLKGELSLRARPAKTKSGQSAVRGPESAAEECFRQAIEIARRQQAKSLELRAVTSLARLWQRQGRREEAHKTLAKIYGWFTEGFDTVDLREAKALLQELSTSPLSLAKRTR